MVIRQRQWDAGNRKWRGADICLEDCKRTMPKKVREGTQQRGKALTLFENYVLVVLCLSKCCIILFKGDLPAVQQGQQPAPLRQLWHDGQGARAQVRQDPEGVPRPHQVGVQETAFCFFYLISPTVTWTLSLSPLTAIKCWVGQVMAQLRWNTGFWNTAWSTILFLISIKGVEHEDHRMPEHLQIIGRCCWWVLAKKEWDICRKSLSSTKH